MNRLRFPILLWVIAPILIALLMRTGLTDVAAASSSAAWKIVPSPNGTDLNTNTLNGVAAVSVNDVWAVGSYNNSDRTLSQTLTMHWDGTRWTVVPSPNKDVGNNKLTAVSGTSTSDVWAVGTFSNTNSGTYQPLTEHWNGIRWIVVNSPVAPSSSDNFLSAVKAIGKNNVWAVGYDYTIDQTTSRTLIEHWDGRQWTVVPSPNTHELRNEM